MKKKHDIAPRQEGETEEDYTRRYNREKKRIQRKDNVRVGRGKRPGGKLKAKTSRSHFTDEEWLALQPQPGEDPNSIEYRRRYDRDKMRIIRARDPGKEQARRERSYAHAKETGYATAKAWRAANPEKVKAHQKRYLDAHPERIELLKAWVRDNPELYAEAKAAWNEDNRPRLASYASAWRAQAKQATPAWADEVAILAVYQERQDVSDATGVEHHVDHTIPLRSKIVCGLHVHTNLRVVPGVENMRKHNKVDFALIYSLYGCDENGHVVAQTEEAEHVEDHC